MRPNLTEILMLCYRSECPRILDAIDSTKEDLKLLKLVLEGRDIGTAMHCLRVAERAAVLADRVGLSMKAMLRTTRAALIHDIGKVAVPDAILRKPSALTGEEQVVMRRHAIEGGNLVRAVDELMDLELIVRHHHERFDGTGYPDGLKGDAIPIGARIVAVADAFDAMTNDRPYRAAVEHGVALTELTRNSGSQFDPEIVHEFTKLFGKTSLYG
jgi:putative nucleotidyltransferase with HDIG domain